MNIVLLGMYLKFLDSYIVIYVIIYYIVIYVIIIYKICSYMYKFGIMYLYVGYY